MISVTYIFHSGFVLQTDRSILVFDYWLDPKGVMRHYQDTSRHTYVFASHFHEDHFTKEIFKWKDDSHTFILSKDILKHKRATKDQADVWLAKGGLWQDENIKVYATGSNDSGVSWIVETEGKCIFHAGDLCNWYARFLADDLVPDSIMSTEFGMINPVKEEKKFLGELKDIRKITDSFDIAMFPVDGRIGNGYTLGGRQFIERFKVGMFIPMHFIVSGFDSAWRMQPFCTDKNIPFWSIRAEGESLALINNLYIRKTNIDDIPHIKEIFAIARHFMASTGNPNQWKDNYPNEQVLHDDIQRGDSYVCISGGRIVATFFLRGGIDPTYNKIYKGAWLNNNPYATIHRIASDGSTKGILHVVLQFALSQYNTIRIDTHRDNIVMQNALAKENFKYCGIIHCWSGDERLAYQYNKQQ